MIKAKNKISNKGIVQLARIKEPKGYRPQIRSRHPTHDDLRNRLPKLPFRSLIRLGSTTIVEDGIKRVEINSIESIKNASCKLNMKRCFSRLGVKSAKWYNIIRKDDGYHCNIDGNSTSTLAVSKLKKEDFPIVSKHVYGSRGRGNQLHQTKESLLSFLESHSDLGNYIFEKFYNYNREYRLHVTREGCFYTCRKMLKEDTPKDKRWFRNDSNSKWFVESNPQFNRPTNWKVIEEHCVMALLSCGLDFGACDVRVQSEKDDDGRTRKDPDFIIIEINSAPSFGDITLQRYLEVIPRLIQDKYKSQKK